MKLDTVVIPVAGLGTRMLPATKAIPKEMLPIVDKPIIQYVVEEIILSGFKKIIFVTHSSKNSVENHFDKSFELEATLEKRIRRSSLKEVRSISNQKIEISSVRQGEAFGLGHAIKTAKNFIGNKPFAVVLPDRVMHDVSCNLRQDNLSFLKKSFESKPGNYILLEKVKRADIKKFGIAKLKKSFNSKNRIQEIELIVEKPSLDRAPSNYAAVGRYIFLPEIFDFIPDKEIRRDKEIELTDSINNLIKTESTVYASELTGECFDCGERQGYLKAILSTAIKRKDTKKFVSKIIKDLLQDS